VRQGTRLLYGFLKLLRGEFPLEQSESGIATRVALERRGGNPEIGGLQVLLCATSRGQHGTHHDASAGMSLERGLLKPRKCHRLVESNATTAEVKIGEIVLRGGFAALRSLAVPASGFGTILTHAKALIVKVAKIDRRGQVT